MSGFARWVNSPRVAGWFLVVATVVCIAGAWISYDMTTALRDRGMRASAVVTDVHGGRDSYVTLTFSDASGTEVTADVGNYSWQPEPQIGDRAEIIYDPEDPEGNVADVRTGPDFIAVWAFGLSGLAAAACIWPTFTGRLDWNRLRD